MTHVRLDEASAPTWAHAVATLFGTQVAIAPGAAFGTGSLRTFTAQDVHIVDVAAGANRVTSNAPAPGVVLNPHTPESTIDYVLDELDYVLLMTVNPGFGGQSLIERVFPKIERVREAIQRRGLSTLVEVDGGVKPANARRFFDAGAQVLVAGSAVFGVPDRAAAIRAIRGEA